MAYTAFAQPPKKIFQILRNQPTGPGREGGKAGSIDPDPPQVTQTRGSPADAGRVPVPAHVGQANGIHPRGPTSYS